MSLRINPLLRNAGVHNCDMQQNRQKQWINIVKLNCIFSSMNAWLQPLKQPSSFFLAVFAAMILTFSPLKDLVQSYFFYSFSHSLMAFTSNKPWLLSRFLGHTHIHMYVHIYFEQCEKWRGRDCSCRVQNVCFEVVGSWEAGFVNMHMAISHALHGKFERLVI